MSKPRERIHLGHRRQQIVEVHLLCEFTFVRLLLLVCFLQSIQSKRESLGDRRALKREREQATDLSRSWFMSSLEKSTSLCSCPRSAIRVISSFERAVSRCRRHVLEASQAARHAMEVPLIRVAKCCARFRSFSTDQLCSWL